MTERTAPQYDFYTTPPAGAVTPPPTAAVPSQAMPPGTPSAPPAPSAPVYGAPVNQFGTPLGTPGATVPAAYAPVQPARSGGVHVPRWVWRFVVPLAVVVVLGLFGVGRLGFLDVVHGGMEAPETLAGLATTDSAEVDGYRALLDSYGAPEDGYVVQAYEGPSASVILVAFDGALEQSDLPQLIGADDPGTTVAIGSTLCLQEVFEGEQLSLCARTGDDRTVMVVHGPADAATAATTLTEAWTHFS